MKKITKSKNILKNAFLRQLASHGLTPTEFGAMLLNDVQKTLSEYPLEKHAFVDYLKSKLPSTDSLQTLKNNIIYALSIPPALGIMTALFVSKLPEVDSRDEIVRRFKLKQLENEMRIGAIELKEQVRRLQKSKNKQKTNKNHDSVNVNDFSSDNRSNKDHSSFAVF